MPTTTSLKNRTALITGASRGVGQAIALQLAQAGVRVIASAQNQERLDAMIQSLRGQGHEAAGFACDLSNPSQVHQLAAYATEQVESLDILINNAGMGLKKPFDECSNDEWNHLMAVNSTAPFILCRELLPSLKKSEGATIINIGSVVGIKGYEYQSVYTASKHALVGFTKVLAQEVQPHGIRVHLLSPGGIHTDMAYLMRPDLDPEGLIQPEEIADVALFLLTHRGNAMIDDIHMRRANGTPWF